MFIFTNSIRLYLIWKKLAGVRKSTRGNLSVPSKKKHKKSNGSKKWKESFESS